MFKYLMAIPASLALLATMPAQASDITVICNVQQTTDGKPQASFKRRYEIDLEPRYFKTSVDTGKGFLGEQEGFPQDINASRIVFVDDGEIMQYYDRSNGEYFYQDVSANIEATGTCTEKTAAPKPDAVKPLPARE
ncbi:hypothetical protein GCM10007205_23930 [Oxalicibacterium flavum]|uniref:Adhesin n=1 Tax=Oxalicibacterium flavum TaxID=179467 RepID=A0A8J2UMZ2_9BURK|nr:hypothetical protein [Oxalicibacterium flavum]GGC14316.1 hypothetical protein GCM10007205_23930 [Oxalicibacterium flavum]